MNKFKMLQSGLYNRSTIIHKRKEVKKMKKILFASLFVAVLFAGCKKQEEVPVAPPAAPETSAPAAPEAVPPAPADQAN